MNEVVNVYPQIDADSIEEPLVKPDWQLLEQLGASISHAMEMSLIGIDVIIDCLTRQYAVIDINSFPGQRPLRCFQAWCVKSCVIEEKYHKCTAAHKPQAAKG
jgi:hypothetical protein